MGYADWFEVVRNVEDERFLLHNPTFTLDLVHGLQLALGERFPEVELVLVVHRGPEVPVCDRAPPIRLCKAAHDSLRRCCPFPTAQEQQAVSLLLTLSTHLFSDPLDLGNLAEALSPDDSDLALSSDGSTRHCDVELLP